MRHVVSRHALAVVGLWLAFQTGPASGQAGEAQSDGHALGPAGTTPISLIAASPDWPDDPYIFVIRGDSPQVARDALVLPDDGARWVVSSPPTGLPLSVKVGRVAKGKHVLFALTADRSDSREIALQRSSDDGANWARVFGISALLDGHSLVVSPDFASDGLILLNVDGRLFRSTDAGESWAEVTPSVDQIVGTVQFSPDYTADRRLFATASTGRFDGYDGDPSLSGSTADHEQSLGVIVSTDGGLSWQPTPAQPAVDSTPFRKVQALALSPTFARDETMLAFAWGPRQNLLDRREMVDNVRVAFFVSRDAGATWKLLREPTRDSSRGAPFPSRARFNVSIAMSPAFAEDGTALATVAIRYGSPSSGSCSVERTTDAGNTWHRVMSSESGGACGGLAFGGDRRAKIAWAYRSGSRDQWMGSTDGGRSWMPQRVAASTDPRGSFVARGGALLVGSSEHGVIVLGPIDGDWRRTAGP